jgi:hypothetical protein
LADLPSHGICQQCLATVLQHGRTPGLEKRAEKSGGLRLLLNSLTHRRQVDPWAVASAFGFGDPIACLPTLDVCRRCGRHADCGRLRAILGLPPMPSCSG